MRRNVLAIALVTAGAAGAQDSEKGYLAAFLEDSLSDAGREVRVTGFTGALSSRATMTTLTVADDLGIWLTLEGVVLDWSQSALLSGNLTINELSAASITLSRLPEAGDTSLPAPEAAGFSLPDLPVSIDIGSIAANRIVLGETVLGQAVEGRLDASLRLANGSGAAGLVLLRTGDGPAGEITLDAAYDNATRRLDLSLFAGEAEGGLVASLLGIPGAPATELRLDGSGQIESFDADVTLATAGEERLSGTVSVMGATDTGHRLMADLSGNLAPLIVPEHAEFLGADIRLNLDAFREVNGRLTVDALSLTARSLAIEGSGSLSADGLPEDFSLTGTLSAPDGQPLLLPFGDVATRIDRASVQISAAQAGDAGWTALVDVAGLDRADLTVQALSLSGSGRIGRTPAGKTFGGTVTFAAQGLLPLDPALALAIGQSLDGAFKFHFLEGSDSLAFSGLRLAGDDLSPQSNLQIAGNLTIGGLDTALLTSGKLQLTSSDLSRFALLAGHPLAGDGTITVSGSASPLSGFLDGVAQVTANGLRIGVDRIDRLLTGASSASLSVLRDETGTRVRAFDLAAGTLSATGKGTLASSGSDLQGMVSIGDLASLDPQYRGSASLKFAVTGTPEAAQLAVTGDANDLRLGIPSVDLLLAGENLVSAKVALADGTAVILSAMVSNRQLSASVSGTAIADGQKLAVTAKLADLGLLIPDVNGPVSLTGDVTKTAAGYGVDLSGRGPGQLDAKVSGTVSTDFASGDLAASGTGQAGLANLFIAPRVVEGPMRYDLLLNGPLALSSLSGRITLSNGRLSDPGFGFALEGLEGLAELSSGNARLSATSRLSSGGMLRVDGPIGLTAPFAADLAVVLDRLRLFDPTLFETTVAGNLRITGPLTGGALVSGALLLADTELRVPESGIDASGALIDITHIHEPADVHATRARAGLLDDTGDSGQGSSATQPFRLDLTIAAPGKIFLRGRGIDAEVGGNIRLQGTSADVVPSGAFSLIRGRLDILGKRLVLSQADLLLEGDFVPTLAVSASSDSDGVTSYVTIEGPADDPKVAFSSSPELPQEEVLARLLFGRALDGISALQAAQLAQAVAVLAGRSGEGLIGKLRKGFGLDDLDVVTAQDGTTALTAGKYISENVYTEVEITQGGSSRISLNLDLRPGVTVKGGVGADGETGIGIFVERDY